MNLAGLQQRACLRLCAFLRTGLLLARLEYAEDGVLVDQREHGHLHPGRDFINADKIWLRRLHHAVTSLHEPQLLGGVVAVKVAVEVPTDGAARSGLVS